VALEIERKFSIHFDLWKKTTLPEGNFLRQGYLFSSPEKTIRVRETNEQGFITIKGKTIGATRTEFEYEIPKAEAAELINNFSENQITKIRYEIIYDGKLWEVDVFEGDNKGLIVAEIELESELETFTLPPLVDEEVTSDERYYNANLVKYPFKNW